MIDSRSRSAAYSALTVQTFIGAFTHFAAKQALGELPWAALAMIRFAGASVLFVAILIAFTRYRLPPRWAWPRIALLGLLGVPLNQGFFLSGLATSTPTHAVLMYALTPLFVFLLALPFGMERPSFAKLTGLTLGLAGAAVVIFDRVADLRGGQIGGDLKILVAVLAWAGYTVLGKPLVEEFGAIAATSWTLTLGTILFLPLGVPAVAAAPLASLTTATWGSIVFLILLTSVVSYLCWYFALGILDPSRAAIFANLQPVITAWAAWAIYGTPLTPALLLGGVLVISGVAVTTRSRVA